MSEEGFTNSSTYTTPTPAPCTPSSSLVEKGAKRPIVFGHQWIKFQDQVQSVTREPLGLGGKR